MDLKQNKIQYKIQNAFFLNVGSQNKKLKNAIGFLNLNPKKTDEKEQKGFQKWGHSEKTSTKTPFFNGIHQKKKVTLKETLYLKKKMAQGTSRSACSCPPLPWRPPWPPPGRLQRSRGRWAPRRPCSPCWPRRVPKVSHMGLFVTQKTWKCW